MTTTATTQVIDYRWPTQLKSPAKALNSVNDAIAQRLQPWVLEVLSQAAKRSEKQVHDALAHYEWARLEVLRAEVASKALEDWGQVLDEESRQVIATELPLQFNRVARDKLFDALRILQQLETQTTSNDAVRRKARKSHSSRANARKKLRGAADGSTKASNASQKGKKK